ncbi:L-threonine 3-dehydrogenase, partial [bacterium]
KAIAKVRSEPGVEIVDVPEPTPGPGEVKIKLEAASVCGTDLHIYNWDPWAAGRIKPPRIIGHEFCGTIVEVGEGVTERAVGDFISSESHIVDPESPWMKAGLGHVDPDTCILGVDVDGGFAEYAVLPIASARPTDRRIPPRIACFQDALGNAVHTVSDGPVEGKEILITGLGPIGLMAASVCRAMGAARVIGTEISPYRRNLAEQVGVDLILDPTKDDVRSLLKGGVDATLEMSGHPSSIELAVDVTREGGRISLLGVYGNSPLPVDLNKVIFKGLRLQGIVGRRLWETWDLMGKLLSEGGLDPSPVVTHTFPFTEFQEAMELMKRGEAGKVVFTF